MAAINVPFNPASAPPSAMLPPVLPVIQDSFHEPRILSRKRRMNFYDLANLLDSDGNLQNEMLVFAFAATMLSTIPVLLGNEFDVNVGLRRRKRESPDGLYPPLPEDPAESSYVNYDSGYGYAPAFFSNYTYKKIMTAPKSTKDVFHIHSDSATLPSEGSAETEESLGDLLRDMLQWSQEKIKDKHIGPMLINLALDKYQGNINPADKLVKVAFKKWRDYYRH